MTDGVPSQRGSNAENVPFDNVIMQDSARKTTSKDFYL